MTRPSLGVVIGAASHNLGPHASGVNDENFQTIRNDPALACKYAAKTMEIYGVYRERSGRDGMQLFNGLVDSDASQIRPHTPKFRHHRREMDFWFGKPYAQDL